MLFKEESRKWRILFAMTSCISMIFIDVILLPVALPAIERQFNATVASLQWIINGYTLALSVFVLAGGKLGDIWEQRRIFCLDDRFYYKPCSSMDWRSYTHLPQHQLFYSQVSLQIKEVLKEESNWGWTSVSTIGLIVLGIGGITAFVLAEREIKHPLIEFKLYKNKVFLGGPIRVSFSLSCK